MASNTYLQVSIMDNPIITMQPYLHDTVVVSDAELYIYGVRIYIDHRGDVTETQWNEAVVVMPYGGRASVPAVDAGYDPDDIDEIIRELYAVQGDMLEQRYDISIITSEDAL
jgi:hypothetical protein